MTNVRSQHECDYCSHDTRAQAVCVLANRGRFGVAACTGHVSALVRQLMASGGEIVRLSGVGPSALADALLAATAAS